MKSFIDEFGVAPEVVASAPGRVNLIGEHTDYNGGYVLPVALARRTTVALQRRADREVRVFTDAGDGRAEYTLGAERRRGDWLDYVQGVTRALAQSGHAVRGFDARIESSVPVGRGLSSSAALEVALLRALREAFALALDDVAIARLGQAAENDFVGAPVGIMDQMAASVGDPGHALFLDAQTMQWERILLPAGMDLVVIDSGIAHHHAGGEYGRRRAECERAAALLGVASLRALSTGDVPRIEALPDPFGRRARHVVTENARVLAMVDALRTRDLARVGAVLRAGHASLRDDFEVSLPQIDELVELACAHPATYGARLTGGGFGGSIVVVTRAGEGNAVGRAVADHAPAAVAARFL
jgi:galactokinase